MAENTTAYDFYAYEETVARFPEGWQTAADVWGGKDWRPFALNAATLSPLSRERAAELVGGEGNLGRPAEGEVGPGEDDGEEEAPESGE